MRKGLGKVLDSLLDFELWLLGEGIPEDWECVDYVYVTEKLIGAFPFAKLYLADVDYYLCPKQDVEEFLAEDPTDQERYVTEVFDCDDFSFRLMGQFHTKPYSALAFGIAWSSVHAYNVFIDIEGKVWIIEPQTDELIEPNEGKEEYKTELIIM